MHLRFILTIPTISLLSACGGSNSAAITPISSSGFAQENQEQQSRVEFTATDIVRTLGDSEGNKSQERQTVSLIVERGSEVVTIILDGESYKLEWLDEYTAEYVDGEDIVTLRQYFADNDDAVGLSLFTIINDELNSGTFILGYDTDPNTVAEISGQASYSGPANAAVRNGFDAAFLNGQAIMTADFDTGRVSGSASLEQTGGRLSVDPIELSFDPTNIIGNGFSGDVTITSDNVDGPYRNAIYEGRFFGDQAQTIGGSFSGQTIPQGDEGVTVVDGIFLVD